MYKVSSVKWPCRSDIELFFDWAMSFSVMKKESVK